MSCLTRNVLIYKRQFQILYFVFVCFSSASAQIHHSESLSPYVDIAEVEVVGRRSLSEIGACKDVIDTTMLKSGLSLSMADVLMSNTGVYVKHSGRATLSTVAIRGTGASHTQVTWNGLKINSPMMGQTDFSSIPAYFVGEAKVLYGTTSLGEASGGLGGAVVLQTPMRQTEGHNIEYTQSIGSYSTYDEYLKIAFGGRGWQTYSQMLVSTSENNFSYINRDRKVNVYDENKNIISQYYPKERNRNGEFRDLHILQQFSMRNSTPFSVDVSCWYTRQNRQRPLLSSSYTKDLRFENRHREQTWRAVAKVHYTTARMRLEADLGYQNMWTAYDYKRDPGNGNMVTLVKSRNKESTLMNKVQLSYVRDDDFSMRMTAECDVVRVESKDHDVVQADGSVANVGYKKKRVETSLIGQVMWRPYQRLGLNMILREEIYDKIFQPLLPAFMVEHIVANNNIWQMVFKSTLSKNYKMPTLNDMYYMPGGNVNLKAESGKTWDIGIVCKMVSGVGEQLMIETIHFNSYVDNWIMWLPTAKGFFSPRNVKKVHSRGIEAKLNYKKQITPNWQIAISGNYSYTKSVNKGEKMSVADKSQGKQLPYIPLHAANLYTEVSWRNWQLTFRWNGYSERYTMSSNASTYTGSLKAYGVENVALQTLLPLSHVDVKVKLSVNNLFDKEYHSILSRPMPGRNYEFAIWLKIL